VRRASPFAGDDEDEGHPQRRQEGQHADVKQEVVQLVDVIGRVDVFNG